MFSVFPAAVTVPKGIHSMQFHNWLKNLIVDLAPRSARRERRKKRNVAGQVLSMQQDFMCAPQVETLEDKTLLSVDPFRVADLVIGAGGSNPSQFVNVNGTLFFSANDGTNGTELWQSDGTSAGTTLVKDIVTGIGGSAPSYLTNVNGTLFFRATDGKNGTELWQSDGTSAGTTLVKDIFSGGGSSSPYSLTNVNGTLFFTGNDGTKGPELWQSDGTSAGTRLVKDISSGSDGSKPRYLTNVNGTLFFQGHDGVNGFELWQSDGTSAGTTLVKDIVSGYGSAIPRFLTNVNGTLFFSATDGVNDVNDFELWQSDGTSAGTTLVKDIVSGSGNSSPSFLTNVNGTLFFTAFDDTNGQELWQSDGTSTGTKLVKDIISGSDSSNPFYLTNVNGTLFFTSNDGTSGNELWQSDGTSAGTTLVKDIRSGSVGSYPRPLTNVNGKLFFSARDGLNGNELWKADVPANTPAVQQSMAQQSMAQQPMARQPMARQPAVDRPKVRVHALKFSPPALVKDINLDRRSTPHFVANVNGTLFFNANDGANGNELWRSDGTSAGTTLVKDIRTGSGYSAPRYLTNVNGTLFFSANDGTNGYQLFQSDGTSAGTTLVKDIRTGIGHSDPWHLTNVDGTLFFNGIDGVNGRELWQSNGTSAGTTLVKDILTGIGHSNPWELTNVNGTLFFGANDGTNGYELWRSDGTSTGTRLVKDIRTGTGSSGSSVPSNLTNVNGTLFFTVAGSTSGYELWRSDGTSAGTTLVKEIGFGRYGLGPRSLTNVNGTLFFNGNDGLNGDELWQSDGTSAGTKIVKDIRSGSGHSSPRILTNVNGTLFFTAFDDTNGQELWQSDGTSAGTRLVKDIRTGSGSSYTNSLTNVNGTLFFSAFDGTNGLSLWSMPVDNTPPAPIGTSGNDAFTLNYRSVGLSYEITMTLSTNGGPVTTLGTFSTDVPLFIDGLGGSDSVHVVGTAGDDTIIVNSSTGLTVNGASLILTSIETRTLAGAAGNDIYKFNADSTLGLFTLDESGGGTDTVDFSLTTTASLSLNMATAGTQLVHATNLSLILGSGATFENAIGGAGADTLFGNSLDNTLTGGAGDDRLIGATGNDLLLGGADNDTYVFVPTTVAEADQVTENVNEGIDTLDFALLTTDVVANLASTSIQPVHTNCTLKLNSATVLENIIGGSGADTLFGNNLDNTLAGDAGDDKLLGSSGSDVLLGGADNDTYIFGAADAAEADQVSENVNEGIDTLNFALLTSGITLNLGTDTIQTVHTNRKLNLNSATTFENAVGGSGGDFIVGNSVNNTLTGNAGNDAIFGGLGDDSLVGGSGNDTYYLDAATAGLESDSVTESSGGGTDTLNFASLSSAVNLSLSLTTIQNVHANRTLQLSSNNSIESVVGGSGNDALIGNALANMMMGGAGDDTLRGEDGDDLLDGGFGNDSLYGNLGNDTFRFDVSPNIEVDSVNELTNEGTDTVAFTVGITESVYLDLGATYQQRVMNNRMVQLNSSTSFENATGGSGNDVLRGNSASNTLNGSAGSDILAGAGDSDSLIGGTGDDSYEFVAVDPAALRSEADSVVELPGQGQDTLNFSSISLNLTVSLALTNTQSVHLKRTLLLSSSSAVENLTGGSGNDSLRGNSLPNRITGGGGNDLLAGAGDNDFLLGGAGDDLYQFVPTSSAEIDTVKESRNRGVDTLDFTALTTAVRLSLVVNGSQAVHKNRRLQLDLPDVIENVFTGTGNDMITGNSLPNELRSGNGHDRLDGGAGSDQLTGGPGNDVYRFTRDSTLQRDTATDSGGVDTLNFSSFWSALLLSLNQSTLQTIGSLNELVLRNSSSFENAVGGSASDTIYGNAASNRISGQAGDDRLYGKGGNDILNGNAGNDILLGGSGHDSMRGDTGRDQISYINFRTGKFAQLMIGVSINMTKGTASGEGSDKFTSIEEAAGSDGKDTFRINSKQRAIGGYGLDSYYIDGKRVEVQEKATPSIAARIDINAEQWDQFYATYRQLEPRDLASRNALRGKINDVFASALKVADNNQNAGLSLAGGQSSGLGPYENAADNGGLGLSGFSQPKWTKSISINKVKAYVAPRLKALGAAAVNIVESISNSVVGAIKDIGDDVIEIATAFGEYIKDPRSGKKLMSFFKTAIVGTFDIVVGVPTRIAVSTTLAFLSELRAGFLGRGLTSKEASLLKSVFGDDINTSRIKVVATVLDPLSTLAGGRAFVHGNVITLPSELFNTMTTGRLTFVHEATHVLQNQRFIDVSGRGARDRVNEQLGSYPEDARTVIGDFDWLRATPEARRSGLYSYRIGPVTRFWRDGVQANPAQSLITQGIEAQASAVEDFHYFKSIVDHIGKFQVQSESYSRAVTAEQKSTFVVTLPSAKNTGNLLCTLRMPDGGWLQKNGRIELLLNNRIVAQSKSGSGDVRVVHAVRKGDRLQVRCVLSDSSLTGLTEMLVRLDATFFLPINFKSEPTHEIKYFGIGKDKEILTSYDGPLNADKLKKGYQYKAWNLFASMMIREGYFQIPNNG